MDGPENYAIRGLIKVAHVLLEGSKETRDAISELDTFVINERGDKEELDSRINMVDDRVDELESSIESFDVEGCDSFNDLKSASEDLESRIDTLEHEDYGDLDLNDFQEFTDLGLKVRDMGEEVELHEHRLGSLETKLEEHKANTIANHEAANDRLDGEVVSIKDLATRLNNAEHAAHAGSMARSELATRLNGLEHRLESGPKHVTADDKIVDAIQKLYELHGMDLDFSLVKEDKEVDNG